jgi:hypothetical protein
MAKRYWKYGYSMGYIGTDTEEEVDLYDRYDKETADSITDEEVMSQLSQEAYEEATEMIDSWAKPSEDDQD